MYTISVRSTVINNIYIYMIKIGKETRRVKHFFFKEVASSISDLVEIDTNIKIRINDIFAFTYIF